MKQLVATRVPPGDRWVLDEEENDVIYGSLTDCLNQIFLVHQATQFFIDAKKGEVYIEDGVEKPQQHNYITIIIGVNNEVSQILYGYMVWPVSEIQTDYARGGQRRSFGSVHRYRFREGYSTTI